MRSRASAPRNEELLARQLSWLIGIRLVVVTSVALLVLFLHLLPQTPAGAIESLSAPGSDPAVTEAPTPPIPGGLNRFVYFLIGLPYLASLLHIVLLKVLARHVVAQAYIQFLGDLLLITGLVYYFGGIASPFSMLYLVVISVASTLLRRRAGMIVATAAYLIYTPTLLALHFGWVPPPPSPFVEEASIFRLTYNLVTHLLGFYAVAFLTSYLARNVSLAEAQLQEKTGDLADLQVVHDDVIQSMSSGLLTTDLSGRITSVNRAGGIVLGRREAELLREQVWSAGIMDLDDWESRTAHAQEHGQVRDELDFQRHGQSIPLGFTLTLLTDAGGERTGFLLVFQDLSDLRRLQEELRIKDRMAAVGELAAGIAHEIGNPLASISGSVQMLAGRSEGDEQSQKLMGILLRESQRLDRTIKSFLKFARPKDRSSVHFDVARLLQDQVELLRNSGELHPGHRLKLELSPASVSLVADPDQISQIFWNLVRNALKAMPNGGILRLSGKLDNSVYRFQVGDTGRGMSRDQRTKIFQPFKSFFEGGTGIGMAIVYRIVQEHGGRLLVESEPSQGTIITVELPIGEPGGTALGGEIPHERSTSGGR